jgi:5-oxoprolinase (ATP-hydrolysing)
MPMIKIVPRGTSSTADAYLTPCIRKYIDGFVSGFDENLTKNARLEFMQSDGGLVPVNKFSGFRAILSGPAAGVVGIVFHFIFTKFFIKKKFSRNQEIF